jgi:hypothetical protein
MRGLGVVTQAAADRARGEPASRMRAFSAAVLVAVGAGVMTYRVLRSGEERDEQEGGG